MEDIFFQRIKELSMMDEFTNKYGSISDRNVESHHTWSTKVHVLHVLKEFPHQFVCNFMLIYLVHCEYTMHIMFCIELITVVIANVA